MARRGWESYCHGCGLCCFEKSYSGFRAFIDFKRPCKFLDSGMRCTVYGRRFNACPDCSRLTIFHALFADWLPDTCGYVQRFRPWRRKKQQIIP